MQPAHACRVVSCLPVCTVRRTALLLQCSCSNCYGAIARAYTPHGNRFYCCTYRLSVLAWRCWWGSLRQAGRQLRGGLVFFATHADLLVHNFAMRRLGRVDPAVRLGKVANDLALVLRISLREAIGAVVVDVICIRCWEAFT